MRYISFGKRLEKILIRLVIVFSVIWVVAQSMLTTDPMRRVIGYVDLEDVMAPLGIHENLQKHYVTLHLVNYHGLPEMNILVNGKSIGNFYNRQVTIQVQQGDIIELDTSNYQNSVDVKVINTSEGVAFPEKGAIFSINKGVLSLGSVQLKDLR